jgi:hypothetical protein
LIYTSPQLVRKNFKDNRCGSITSNRRQVLAALRIVRGTGRRFRIERLFAVRCGVLVRLWLRALGFEVGVSGSWLAMVSCILACPALVAALSLGLLPNNRVVWGAGKGVAPPVGWAE